MQQLREGIPVKAVLGALSRVFTGIPSCSGM